MCIIYFSPAFFLQLPGVPTSKVKWMIILLWSFLVIELFALLFNL